MGRAPAPPQKKRIPRRARKRRRRRVKRPIRITPLLGTGSSRPKKGPPHPRPFARRARASEERARRAFGGGGGGLREGGVAPSAPLLLGMRFCEGSGRKCGSKKTGTPNRPLFPPPLDKPRAPKGSSPFGSGNHAPPKRGARRLAAWRNEDGQNRAQRPAPKNKNASPSRRARPCSPVAPSAPKSRFCRTDATAPRR